MISQDPLNSSYDLSVDHVARYCQDGFVKLEHVLPPNILETFGTIITDRVRTLNTQDKPLDERDTYGRAFLQVMNLWTKSEDVKQFVFSRRLAEIATKLMGVRRVRLYHDQALYKEAGGGYTPWHADQYYWPLASDKCITAWIPLQDTPLQMGALEFSRGSQALEVARDVPISDESEALIDGTLAGAGLDHVAEPYNLGDVSFHAGWTFHRAAPNTSDSPRRVMCIIYMDAEMKLKEPLNDHQRADRDTWCPGSRVGEVINSPVNPVLF